MTDENSFIRKCIFTTLSDAQFLELERRLIEAEVEWAVTQQHGPKQKHIEFYAIEWLRRLVDELKQRRGV